jgi:DNA-binding LacI/PurR family transcriptional regulator
VKNPTGVVGLAEIARIAGVSRATVSRALSDSNVVAKETKVRIQALAREHGMRLNQAASALRTKRTGAIGVVIPLGHEADQHLSDPFFMGLIAPLADRLADAGYDLLLSRVIPHDPDWLAERVEAGRVDGAIVIGQSDQTAVIEQVAGRYTPLVVWGARVAGGRQITVGSDNRAGGRVAAEHLLARGRRRLAFLGNPAAPEFAERLAGFRSVGGEEAIVLPLHLTTEEAFQEFASFLASHPAPDGIVAASDVIAMSAVRALAERGFRVPDDVSVIGYDDIPVAKHTTPPLTTVRQDMDQGAALLVDLLLRRMRGETVESIEMAPELIVRGSS